MHDQQLLSDQRGYRMSTIDSLRDGQSNISSRAIIGLGFAIVYLGYFLLKYFDLISLSPLEWLWSCLVWSTPERLLQILCRMLKVHDGRVDFDTAATASERRSMKSEALRGVLGLSPHAMTIKSAINVASHSSPKRTTSMAPPGLGNWDNSCYQNSILQGLASLQSLHAFFGLSTDPSMTDSTSTTGALNGLIRDLTNADNNGARLWTPAKLKSMSSWQQQDAQEYYSRILDDMEKDLQKGMQKVSLGAGLASLTADVRATEHLKQLRSPLEGLLGQRVACLQCGHSDGLSLFPFNCLTLSLGSQTSYTLEDRLNDYVKLENIEQVECTSCTFQAQRRKLQSMLGSRQQQSARDENAFATLALPEEVQKQIAQRLQKVQQVLAEQDFSDDSIKRCGIQKGQRVSTTKTKQVAIARTPQSLVIHINRSIFDEATGALRKNSAFVTYPRDLHLGDWLVGRQSSTSHEVWSGRPGESLVGPRTSSLPMYRLSAIVTHFGRHDNGHYVCYRRSSSTGEKGDEPRWWRLSDDEVTETVEETVLNQAGVFMLFYELLEAADMSSPAISDKLLTHSTPAEQKVGLEVSSLQTFSGVSAPTTNTVKATEGDTGSLEESATATASTPAGIVQQRSAEDTKAPAPASPRMRTARGTNKGKRTNLTTVLPTVAAQ